MCGYDGHRGSVNYLAVSPSFQGHGLARTLMSQVQAMLTAQGCPKLNLMVRQSNAQVTGFYKRLGYTEDPVVVMGARFIRDE